MNGFKDTCIALIIVLGTGGFLCFLAAWLDL